MIYNSHISDVLKKYGLSMKDVTETSIRDDGTVFAHVEFDLDEDYALVGQLDNSTDYIYAIQPVTKDDNQRLNNPLDLLTFIERYKEK